jgi:hypothetical protein
MRPILIALACLASPVLAQGYDPEAPCGRDETGLPYACTSVAGNMLEATCQTTANPYYCLPYHQRACQVSGFAVACQVYQIGANCQGGDPNLCQYYVQILQANTACSMNGDQNACTWLLGQGF